MWVDSFRTAVSSLRGNWLRSTLTSLGVIIGIAAVIVMVSVGQGTQNEIDKMSPAWVPTVSTSARDRRVPAARVLVPARASP